jgi:uncharacterized membrane protein
MDDNGAKRQAERPVQFVLHPHRSLSPRAFLILMAFISTVSFVAGMVFLMMGAWPVFGFFGLDVALIYFAFRLNFRDGRIYEMIDISPSQLTLTRVHPAGKKEAFDFNPYWARVRFKELAPDGRTALSLAAQGREVTFAQFLTDEERLDLAQALNDALLTARTARA